MENVRTLWTFFLLGLLARVEAENGYRLNQTVLNNKIPFYINNEGLTGIFAGFQALPKKGYLEYTLWFITSTIDNSFTLSLIVSNNPPFPANLSGGWIPTGSQAVEGRILWSANRNRPVQRDASLNFTSDGDLILRDRDGTFVWSTNTSGQQVAGLWMTDSGSLETRNRSSTVWRSSDYPTDSLMQNQFLKTGGNLTSSVSMGNTSEGNYSLVLEAGRLVLYAKLGTTRQPYWIWQLAGTDYKSVGICYDGSKLVLKARNSTDDSCVESNGSTFDMPKTIDTTGYEFLNQNGTFRRNETFLKLDPNGDLQVHAWQVSVGNWTLVHSIFGMDRCSLPMVCGYYGICTDGNCTKCPVGVPVLDRLGCESVMSNDCNDDTFVELQGYDYFASNLSSDTLTTGSAVECRNLCNNCSCKAAFYRDGGHCFLAWNTIGTIRKVNGTGYIAFLRGARRVTVAKRIRTAAIAGGVIGGLTGLCLVGLLGYRIFRKPNDPGAESDEIDEEDSMLELSIRSILPARYSYKELEELTNGFSEKLGSGAFGSVYKGVLADGTFVAVKKLENSSKSNLKEFYAEISSLARNRHWYLLQLLGYSMKRSSRLLVYEFMENGSLDTWLFDEKKRPVLSWKLRFNIALGTAKGLVYLHEECSEKIIHLDLKPQNILLDWQFNAKIGDFGLSKLVDREQSMVMTMMRGTPGYLAPEWLVECVISEKVDVFSFGVVLLELVIGRRSNELMASRSSVRELALKDQDVQQGSETEALLQLVDASLELSGNSDEMNQIKRALKVAILCIEDNPLDRPAMSKVVQMLEGSCPVPKLLRHSSTASSTFSIQKFLRDSGSCSSGPVSSTGLFSSGTVSSSVI